MRIDDINEKKNENEKRLIFRIEKIKLERVKITKFMASLKSLHDINYY